LQQCYEYLTFWLLHIPGTSAAAATLDRAWQKFYCRQRMGASSNRIRDQAPRLGCCCMHHPDWLPAPAAGSHYRAGQEPNLLKTNRILN
jgi:hypothetical protein